MSCVKTKVEQCGATKENAVLGRNCDLSIFVFSAACPGCECKKFVHTREGNLAARVLVDEVGIVDVKAHVVSRLVKSMRGDQIEVSFCVVIHVVKSDVPRDGVFVADCDADASCLVD